MDAKGDVKCFWLNPTSDCIYPYYLTAEELAERINYDPRTIRDSLKDRVFKEGRHYTRIGRKILWIWETIDKDMRDGTFRILQSAAALD